MSEKELIREAIKGNRKAQTALYHQYKSTWFVICLRYNKNRYDAEDCLQNALIHIFSNLKQFNPKRGTFKNWSNRIMVNTSIQYLKKENKFQHTELNEDIDQKEKELDEKEYPITSENMVKLVQQLPTGYRSIFNLYVVEGYSHKEIAGILNISVGTSKSQLAKAKRLLRNQLEKVLKSVY